MLFILCEHYDETDTLYDNINKECFICLQDISANELNKDRLNRQNLFIKNCRCDGFVHNNCLMKWFDKYKSCPICRKLVVSKNCVYIIVINYIPFVNLIYRLSFQIARICLFFIFTYSLLEFYIVYSIKKNTHQENDHISYHYYLE
jgi:hypothetical protein